MSLTVTMISNYINHHQMPFSDAMYEKLGNDYCFIQTERMEKERSDMGWGVDENAIPYLKLLYEDEVSCIDKIMNSDILIVGWQEKEELILPRIEAGKFTVRVSERIYREGQWKFLSPKGLIRKYKEHTRFRKSNNVYLLCAGAYVASDFSLVKAYPDKMLKFGYFPKFRELKVDLKPSAEDEIQIIWAGRFIPLKHPEFAVNMAAELKEKGYKFHLHFIGSGEMEGELKSMSHNKGLDEYITFYGFVSPDKVREIMDKCHIHIFTSNYLEGWGAVVNEGMNSACLEIVNSEVGAAPFLIKHGENGLLYKKGSYDDFIKQVSLAFENPKLINEYGYRAYETIKKYWNAENAANELLSFYGRYLNGKAMDDLPKDGPMSKAIIIKP